MLAKLASLDWTQAAGVLAAFVLFFDRLAKIIPNESLGTAVGVLQKICAVLGVKVPEVK